jgi:hypothetical protein
LPDQKWTPWAKITVKCHVILPQAHLINHLPVKGTVKSADNHGMGQSMEK